ncbi:unnamed protein product [Didymodactylos carnosus]|uniref:Uncharacterized protein n=1 Tax=Didymodactylos carnosus TaxID=1234261 RepID=A0A814A9G8_9BILA|nr:unnamed protein product [Didymodactylos carnosus]CAF3692427.1 unnamed protein product [Didymodactylos carnosus]
MLFSVEDIIKERIRPNPTNGFKSYEVRESNSANRQPSIHSDDAMPLSSPTPSTLQPRLSTSPFYTPQVPATPVLASPVPVSPRKQSTSSTLINEATVAAANLDKSRQGTSSSNGYRTIEHLEKGIQQVKDNNFTQELKHEYEHALEVLRQLIKIEQMRNKILRLTQATIAELHSYAKPPEEISTVMKATFLLLGYSNKDLQRWSQIQALLGRLGRNSVKRRCYELNPLEIPMDKAREAKAILRNYDLLRVSEISVGLSVFYNWTMTMIEEREMLLEFQHRIRKTS